MKKFIPKIIGTYLNVLSYISVNYAANKALLLFSTPRKGQITDRQKTFLMTATKEVLHYKDLPIMTYHWKGNKQTLLLVHGWESNTSRWKNKVKRFIDEGFNIVALDGPAHGASGSTIFNALLYSEFINVVVKKFNPQILIGHSVGGMACVFLQKKHQYKTIDKIVLLGTPSELKDVLKRYSKMLGYNKKIEKQLNTIILNRFGVHPDHFSTSKFLEEITTQGLIMHDIKDTIIPFSDAKLISKSYKNASLVTTLGLGHSLNHKSVTKTILDFINP